MFGLHEMTVGTSVERTFLLKVSEVVALGAEGFPAVFCWGIFEG